ncbi:MAG TPA: acyl-CoA synthetase [Alphaproteobacteria bacterium]|nr:acyl-CoA synthetase [Alphaproteobacteria bacterium]
MESIYEKGLSRNAANYSPLTPVSFIARAADVYGGRTAVIHDQVRRSWNETYTRVRRLASGLQKAGIGRGDTVAVLLPNTPEMIEAHFAIPMAGGVLNTLNTRLDPDSIRYMLQHGEAQALLVDREFGALADQALKGIDRDLLVIDVPDPAYGGEPARMTTISYEALLDSGNPDFPASPPDDEWDAIALNYTSGTTAHPKGVVYHHRGAYLNAISNILEWDLPKHPVYLWTLPMFHCNGWCFPWTIAARAGLNVCLRKVEAPRVLELIARHQVTHYCGAPIVHSMLAACPSDLFEPIRHRVHAMIAGAAPPTALLAAMEEKGFDLRHVYGLTEVYGPAAVCDPQEAWTKLGPADRAQRRARQGVRYHLQEAIDVLDRTTGAPVPADAETIGEVVFRGNICMKGYLKNPEATEEAFAGGWFHTGDLGVKHPDGYIKLKDRSKDIIVSGGENISSIEIEDVLHLHPAVMAAAVVAKSDPKWGETPYAFVELKPEALVTTHDLLDHCRNHLAGFKVPRAIEFCELPKTSTGKIQKSQLRLKLGSKAAIDS